jgi:hypothetical protein
MSDQVLFVIKEAGRRQTKGISTGEQGIPRLYQVVAFSPKVQVFCPSSSPDGQKEKEPLCTARLCGEKILPIIRNGNYELEHLVTRNYIDNIELFNDSKYLSFS